jgi:hypothetical protein
MKLLLATFALAMFVFSTADARVSDEAYCTGKTTRGATYCNKDPRCKWAKRPSKIKSHATNGGWVCVPR